MVRPSQLHAIAACLHTSTLARSRAHACCLCLSCSCACSVNRATGTAAVKRVDNLKLYLGCAATGVCVLGA